MDLSFTPTPGGSSAARRAFLGSAPRPTWAQLAELGWTGAGVPEGHGGAGLTFVEEAVLHEEAGRALLHAPLWSTSSSSFLPGSDQAASPGARRAGRARTQPFRPDLDTAANVAVVGGDTIWELDGADREVLATSDETRPLGVVSGGEARSRLCSSDVLPSLRSRSLGDPWRSGRWRRVRRSS